MRPKVVLGIFLVAACVVAFVVLLPKKAHAPAATPPPASAPAPEADLKPIPVPAPPQVAVTLTATAPPVVTTTDTNAAALKKEQHAEYIKNRADQLMAMAMLKDTASHQPIIEDLTNSDRAIRKVALEAVQQTQDRALIPQMQQIADTTDDEDYKQALDDAIAYMKLPTLTEVMQQAKAQQQNGTVNPSTQQQPPPPGHNHGAPPSPPPGQGQP